MIAKARNRLQKDGQYQDQHKRSHVHKYYFHLPLLSGPLGFRVGQGWAIALASRGDSRRPIPSAAETTARARCRCSPVEGSLVKFGVFGFRFESDF